MNEQKRIAEIKVGDRFSAQGLSYTQLPISHIIDEIHVMSDTSHVVKAKLVIYYLKLYGWQETEDSPKETILTRYKCLSCGKIYDIPQAECPKCRVNRFHSYSMKSMRVMLEKMPSLRHHQKDVVEDKENKTIIKLIAAKDVEKRYEDNLIYEGWKYQPKN